MTGTSPLTSSCTAFDDDRRIAAGTYASVAGALKDHLRQRPDAVVLVFDDTTGNQIDFDLRGTDTEIAARLSGQFPAAESRGVGRPKLGVVSREVTLLPQHWDWLGEQPGGASAALRRLVEEARRAGPSETAQLRKAHERAYKFMSAIAGNRPAFEEASRALFANDIATLKQLIAGWPADIRRHVLQLCSAA